ncbi:MAG: hypothetical protein FD132_2033 [bacterium]|nr:MAG: hypothetical protein FD132_2033 [bacterium]
MKYRALPALLVLASLVMPGAAQAQTTYRWVDEQGRVHYGDVMPSKDAGLGNVELDKQGRVKKETPRTRLSPEERARLEAEERRREEARRLEEARQRRDRALVTTYVNEAEIDLARSWPPPTPSSRRTRAARRRPARPCRCATKPAPNWPSWTASSPNAKRPRRTSASVTRRTSCAIGNCAPGSRAEAAQPSFLRSSSLTWAGLALPLLAFMT